MTVGSGLLLGANDENVPAAGNAASKPHALPQETGSVAAAEERDVRSADPQLSSLYWEFCVAYIGGRDSLERFLSERLPEIFWSNPRIPIEICLVDTFGRGELRQRDELEKALVRLSFYQCLNAGMKTRRNRVVRAAVGKLFEGESLDYRLSFLDRMLGDSGIVADSLDTMYLEMLKLLVSQPSSISKELGRDKSESLRQRISLLATSALATEEEVHHYSVLANYICLDLAGFKESFSGYMEKYGADSKYGEQLHLTWIGLAITLRKLKLPGEDPNALDMEAELAYAQWRELFGANEPPTEWGLKIGAAYEKVKAVQDADRIPNP